MIGWEGLVFCIPCINTDQWTRKAFSYDNKNEEQFYEYNQLLHKTLFNKHHKL